MILTNTAEVVFTMGGKKRGKTWESVPPQAGMMCFVMWWAAGEGRAPVELFAAAFLCEHHSWKQLLCFAPILIGCC